MREVAGEQAAYHPQQVPWAAVAILAVASSVREHVEFDPWARLKVPAAPRNYQEAERAFTDGEVLALLSSPASPRMHDLMRIAALTGARLDTIVSLRVGDCAAGLFTFKPQKREEKPRSVPIHSALGDVVERRAGGQSGD